MDSAACQSVGGYKRNVSLRLELKRVRQFPDDYRRMIICQGIATSKSLSYKLTCHHKGNGALKGTCVSTVFLR